MSCVYIYRLLPNLISMRFAAVGAELPALSPRPVLLRHPRWTPLKLYQQTINGGACNLLPLFSSSNVLQTPEVVTGREIFCKWHLAKGQIQGPSG